jgi:hypothetical protein
MNSWINWDVRAEGFLPNPLLESIAVRGILSLTPLLLSRPAILLVLPAARLVVAPTLFVAPPLLVPLLVIVPHFEVLATADASNSSLNQSPRRSAAL